MDSYMDSTPFFPTKPKQVNPNPQNQQPFVSSPRVTTQWAAARVGRGPGFKFQPAKQCMSTSRSCRSGVEGSGFKASWGLDFRVLRFNRG